MIKHVILLASAGMLWTSCTNKKASDAAAINEEPVWTIDSLAQVANNQLDSTKWDRSLLVQDIETYGQYAEAFNAYPLNKSPFPVAEYDYAVSYIPFVIETDSFIFKGIRVGEYPNPESDSISDKLTLLVLTNDKDAEETTMVESRNAPYLTAQGCVKTSNNDYDWLFSASPDGYAMLIVNMKLFDLRFGETILIYPQKDRSFRYQQLKIASNDHLDLQSFKSLIMNHAEVKRQLVAEGNIR